jgi:hypothetical protein
MLRGKLVVLVVVLQQIHMDYVLGKPVEEVVLVVPMHNQTQL